VLPALTQATRVTGSGTASLTATAEEPLTITVVLKRDDQRGFDTYLSGLYTRGTRNYRRFLSQTEIADRFGPSRQSYDAVLAWLQGQGFTLTEGSDNRLTLTVRGARSQTQRAFAVAISDYRIDQRTFYATEQDPALPANIAQYVQAIVGLSNLAQPKRPDIVTTLAVCGAFLDAAILLALGGLTGLAIVPLAVSVVCTAIFLAEIAAYAACLYGAGGDPAGQARCDRAFMGNLSSQATASGGRVQAAANAQKVGLVEFDAFRQSDVADWLRLINPASVTPQLSRLSTVAVNGGVATPGLDEAEVLLDVNMLLFETNLSTNIVVYEASPVTSYQTLFNRMINDGVTVISNSWSYCEDQTTLADVQSIDSILQSAAGAGISVFNASGDTGSTCLDGSPNTVGVPANVPNATAVGGSSMTSGVGATYGSERWWDGTQSNPPTGQGGFGVSRFFTRPAYQNGSTASPMRSVPDTVLPADPAQGLGICQASNGGCPNGKLYGGTSMAAPAWAAFAVFLNQSTGVNLGFLNPQLYPLAGTTGFHSAASMNSDFAHVGLGSPNPDMLRLLLTGQTAGPVDPASSFVRSTPTPVSADGTTRAFVQVNLLDNRGRIVTGKNVALTAGPGSRAVISPPSGPSSVNGGAVVFTVTDTFAENLTLTATDTTDNITLSTTINLSFVTPPATAGNIIANPTSVAADGTAFSTITVTLQNAQSQGAAGKVVNLLQGNGHSTVTGPTPAVTDTSGQTTFTVTNTTAETVTYSAIDVTDGDLPIPGTAAVTFTSGPPAPCLLPIAAAAAGYAVTTFASGFATRGPTPTTCLGPIGVAFDPVGNLWVSGHVADGSLYKFGPRGGAVNDATRVSTGYACPDGLAFSKTGNSLYLSEQWCSGFLGDVLQLNPATGLRIRSYVGNLGCASGAATDPLTGDLFVSTPCGAFGTDKIIWRVKSPESASPQFVQYATLPGVTDGIAFAPDGTLYTAAGNPADNVTWLGRLTGTGGPATPVFTYVAQAPTADGIAVGRNPGNPSAPPIVYVNRHDGKLTRVDLSTATPTLTDVFTGGSFGDFVTVGPDGCIYATQSDRILKVTRADGNCDVVPTSAFPTLSLTPPAVQPSPQQGTPVTLSATFFNVSVPAGTPVSFLVSGANTQVKQATTDANGIASFTYSGVKTGTDTIQASATVNGSTLTSNTAAITWAAG
ncbi:MAG: Ig-like domain-containing protein, partial [Chloroflexi bacterium]|nr:Ig-like domain-containing protein [Chloroflexota bacterium]